MSPSSRSTLIFSTDAVGQISLSSSDCGNTRWEIAKTRFFLQSSRSCEPTRPDIRVSTQSTQTDSASLQSSQGLVQRAHFNLIDSQEEQQHQNQPTVATST